MTRRTITLKHPVSQQPTIIDWNGKVVGSEAGICNYRQRCTKYTHAISTDLLYSQLYADSLNESNSAPAV